jgi:hypothetical protein
MNKHADKFSDAFDKMNCGFRRLGTMLLQDVNLGTFSYNYARHFDTVSFKLSVAEEK